MTNTTSRSDGASRTVVTILAALRCYQRSLRTNDGVPPADLQDIASNGEQVVPMSVDEIDELCEMANFGEIVVMEEQLGLESAIRIMARAVIKRPMTLKAVTNIGQLVADALEIVSPDSHADQTLARNLAEGIAQATASMRVRKAA